MFVDAAHECDAVPRGGSVDEAASDNLEVRGASHFLVESVWYPIALLPARARIGPVDTRSAKATLVDGAIR